MEYRWNACQAVSPAALLCARRHRVSETVRRVQTPPTPGRDGTLNCRVPCVARTGWIDANHAPHYMHLPFILWTTANDTGLGIDVNRFVTGGHSRDFRGARVTLRVRGPDFDGRGATLKLLVQGTVSGMAPGQTLNFVYDLETFDVTEDWSEQTITVNPDPAGWTYLSSRGDLADRYVGGDRLDDITELLADVDLDILLVLHNVAVVPAPGETVDSTRLHSLWPRNADLPKNAPGGGPSTAYNGVVPFDFAADPAWLPTGAIEIELVEVHYATAPSLNSRL